MLITSRKKIVGVTSGNWMSLKRRSTPEPSIEAASINERGMLWKAARKKMKL